ncbi:hypothetical protein PS015_24015, partial [Shigella sonnei]|nr:hypothetical protein [Shigella sonnei]
EQEQIILNSDAIQGVGDESMVANSELFALVQEYNRIARTCGTPEQEQIILNSDAIQRVCDEFMVANSE